MVLSLEEPSGISHAYGKLILPIVLARAKDLLRAYEMVHGYVKVHGGGWYLKDDVQRTITLYGSSGDYGDPRLAFLNRIPGELRDYTFLYTPFYGIPGNPLELDGIEWI